MAVSTTYPGVYVEETPNGQRPITGVSTSIAAFVGAAKSGSSNHPLHISSFGEFTQRFGGLVSELELGYSVQQFFLNGGHDAWVVRVPRNANKSGFVKGIKSLDGVDLLNLLVLPGITEPAILRVAADYCYKRRAFLIVDAPRQSNTPAALDEATIDNTFPRSSNCALYYPWIRIPDPLKNGQLRSAPPSGTVAGIMARIDDARGVWKAPAGTEANLIGVTALEYDSNDAENGTLNLRGVNCLRVLPGDGLVVWGGRTLRGDDQSDPQYKYISVRRLALFIEESIYRGTQWVVFEPNDDSLWAQIRLNIGAFLMNLFRMGAFQGRTPAEAFFVKCDRESTTNADVARGVVNLLVGFAPIKPAEFVIVKITQVAAPPP
jgi:phage tail sheath protein FI